MMEGLEVKGELVRFKECGLGFEGIGEIQECSVVVVGDSQG